MLVQAGQSLRGADYRIEYAQLNDAGELIEHSTWHCADVAIEMGRCDQGIMVVIDGRPQPVDISMRMDGSVLRITAARSKWRVAVTGAKEKSMVMDHKGVLLVSPELWDTNALRHEDESGFNDLVAHPAFRKLASVHLLVQRYPLRHPMADYP